MHAKQPNAAAAQSAAAARQTTAAAQTRAERLHERRVLRSLPADQRAAKREEFRRQRLNAQSNTQAQPNAALQSNAAVQSNALAHRRNARRDHGTTTTAQAARQGRFASRFAARRASANAAASANVSRIAARRAWHHHHRAGFVAWYGPVFWPYAYSDIFDYAFWPDGYDEGYWDYAYDDFFDGLFWGEQGAPVAYGYSAPAAANAAP